MLTRIDHVGIACHDLDAKIEFYETHFGLTVARREVNEAAGRQGGDAARRRRARRARPTCSCSSRCAPDTPVGKFLAKRGEGVHHIGYGVADVDGGARRPSAATGVRLLDERPRHGSMGASIAFLHPKDVGGVLTELVQAPTECSTEPRMAIDTKQGALTGRYMSSDNRDALPRTVQR